VLVRTYLVRYGSDTSYREWIGNAETHEEAVLYAMARTGMDTPLFLVYDHDLNRYEVPRPEPRPMAES